MRTRSRAFVLIGLLGACVPSRDPAAPDAGATPGSRDGGADLGEDAGAASHDAVVASVDGGESAPDAGAAPGPDAGRCGVCPNAQPVCALADDTCVECETSQHCTTTSRPACAPSVRRCVECQVHGDCSGAQRFCLDQTCVQCRDDQDCLSRCDQATGLCVQCLEHQDCQDRALARCEAKQCVACQANADCDGVTDFPACVGGRCEECFGTEYSRCGDDQGVPLVCDSANLTCSSERESSADICQACVSDAECMPGQRCVMETFDGTDLGYVCRWEQGAGVGGAPDQCSDAAPYVGTADLVSVDSVSATVCALRLTTCGGYATYSAADVTLCSAGTPPQPIGCGDDRVFSDTHCRPYILDQQPVDRCTVPCFSSADCGGQACDTGVIPAQCAFAGP